MELAEQLEEQGYSEETVLEKVSLFRSQLLNKEVGPTYFPIYTFISGFKVYLVDSFYTRNQFAFP